MATIRLRRGTAAAWTANNPVLGLGEPGIETDTQLFKFGNGATAWNDLPYASADSAAVHAGTATLASGTVTVLADWVTPDTVIVVTGQDAPGTAGTNLYVDPVNIVDGVSFDISSTMGADARAVFWMATEPTEDVESNMVLLSDGSGGDAYLYKDLGSAVATNIWMTFDVAFSQAYLDFIDASAGGSAYMAELDDTDFGDATLTFSLTDALEWLNVGIGGWTEASPAPAADTWQHIELHYEKSTAVYELFIDTVLVGTYDAAANAALDIQHIRIGQLFPWEDPVELVYFKNVKIGTTREGVEYLEEDFSGDLSAWAVTGDCTIVADPF